MKVNKIREGYMIVLHPGDKVMECFNRFAKENSITSAVFSGLGAFSQVEIGHYNITTRRYLSETYTESLEVLNINGNITMREGRPFVHMHTILSDPSMKVIGGHLVEAEVSVTLELYVRELGEPLTRKMNEDIGLYLID